MASRTRATVFDLESRREHAMTKTFVLCHGTWHGGWAWERVIHELHKLGHYALAPTMAGHGPNVERHGITHKDCADSVAECIREHELRDVILVGHSLGRHSGSTGGDGDAGADWPAD